ncbi:hypothetical protein [Williamsia muralis]|uniref:Uncharacterized protein n=1 Tax=Williamsia marianensis TaxID=85044 RepID=A0ABU4EP90_WILMA|nr:hypothetical protein [Williamsia muralis]MDV7133069.1 hypothetical protein [Williamsia muralis]
MYIQEIEGKVLEWFRRSGGHADVETLRRCVPIRRDQFDNFIFEATLWAMDEGAADSFSFACSRFKAAYRSDPNALGSPVPLVTPAVTERVGSIVSRWQLGRQVAGAIDLPVEEARLRDELYLNLGGDLGDGLAAAGRRLCSRMWSARIGGGFVHPVVGGHIWNSNTGSYGGDDAEGGGPLIDAIYAVGEMTGRWQSEPDSRPVIDREIIDLAHTLGWKL